MMSIQWSVDRENQYVQDWKVYWNPILLILNYWNLFRCAILVLLCAYNTVLYYVAVGVVAVGLSIYMNGHCVQENHICFIRYLFQITFVEAVILLLVVVLGLYKCCNMKRPYLCMRTTMLGGTNISVRWVVVICTACSLYCVGLIQWSLHITLIAPEQQYHNFNKCNAGFLSISQYSIQQTHIILPMHEHSTLHLS